MTHLRTRTARHDDERIAAVESDAIVRLRPLLAAAAELALDDRHGWARLRRAARSTTAVLAAGGALPDHLTVGTDDPPVLVTRTIAAAWRHATSAPTRRTVDRGR